MTGDVASEGVNLHSQCHQLIHFDIPWSLIRIEQRNGRIDRYGQKHRPQITTLLLDPDNANFAGDVRVLEKLLEREGEAHNALGDVASLMGEYDVRAEEDEIRRVLAGQKSLDDVVQSVEDVMVSKVDPIGAILARLAAGASQPSGNHAEAPTPATEDAGTGLFADDTAFLRRALAQAFAAPSDSVANNGVGLREHTGHSLLELEPPRDLIARLEVLPQSYLSARKVTEKFMLAVSELEGKRLLDDARNNKASSSSWPEAHFLGPLHPVLDWASDRALASLGRNQIFAMRGDVDVPTLLIVATLSNGRGQVVARSFITAESNVPSKPDFILPTAFASAREALKSMGIDEISQVNPGPVPVASLQGLVAPAVRASRILAEQLAQSSRASIDDRVNRWSHRLDEWERNADSLAQVKELKSRRLTVEQERKLTEQMKPNQQLVRPLLAVVPHDEPVIATTEGAP